MKIPRLWEVSLVTTTEAEDAVRDLFESVLGTAASSYTDLRSGAVKVSAYLSSAPDEMPRTKSELHQGVERIKRYGLKVGAARLSVRKLPHENWAESWKRHFKAFEVGTALLIKPGWSKRHPKRGQAVVTVDPGLSFGTGQHPTTAFCLSQLAKNRTRDSQQSLLDIGTGSGILAIAAAKLGYSPVDAFDHDPQAVRMARGNARANRVGKAIRISVRDLTRMPPTGREYSVVCANLVAPLLISERGRLLAKTAPGGVLVLAGILKSEFAGVRRIYQGEGLKLVASRALKEWRSVAFLKPAN